MRKTMNALNTLSWRVFALLLSVIVALIAFSAQAQTNPKIDSLGDDDFKKFPPPVEVVKWGFGAYGGVRGTVNTTFRSLNPTYTPTVSLAGEEGFTLDVLPQADFGVTLYAPSLFAEKIGLNLDLGLATYTFGTQMWPRFILNDSSRDQYLSYVRSLPTVANDPVKAAQQEVVKFQTTAQFLTVAPSLNLGGLLLGVNIGVPMPFLSASTSVPKSDALRFAESTEAIDVETGLRLFIEPRIGLQAMLFSIKNVGSLFFNINASYALFDSPITSSALQPINAKVERAILDLPLGFTAQNFRFPAADDKRARFDEIVARPLSISAGLSFMLNFTNKAEQEEFLQEERKADSIRAIAIKEQNKVDYLRAKSIALADSAINTIIENYKMSERLADIQKRALTQKIVETEKKVFQAFITSVTGVREDGSSTPENPTLHVEQFASNTRRAFEPTVFFEAGSAALSSRYRKIQSAERESYKMPSDANITPMNLHAQILNIIGKRMTENPSAKITLSGGQTRDESDGQLAEKRVETVASYFQDVWRIPSTRIIRRTEPAAPQNQMAKRAVTISSDTPSILAPLAIESITRIATPPILNIGMEINAGAGLKQWELEAQQIVNNEPIILKEARGGSTVPPKYEWRLNDEPATIPQSSEPIILRLAAYDVNNAAAPDAPVRTLKVEQVSLQDKRKTGAPDKNILHYEFAVGETMNDLSASALAALEAAKQSITPQSRVSVTVFGGNAAVNARAVAQSLRLDARSAVLRDAAPLTTAQTPEAAAYARLVRIRVESPAR